MVRPKILDDPLINWLLTMFAVLVIAALCVAIAVVGGMWLREAR